VRIVWMSRKLSHEMEATMKSLLLAATCLVLPTIGMGGADEKKPVVGVSVPVVRKVVDHLEMKARLGAKDSIVIVPRVTGYLVETPAKEGSTVQKGDVLFKVDPRPYQALLAAAEAKVRQCEASLEYARETNNAFKELAKKKRDAVTDNELRQYQALETQALAARTVAQTEAVHARLNLEFTVVRAPIDGRVGRFFMARGNLVKQDETNLTTLVSVNPIVVYLDIDEVTFFRVRKVIEGQKAAAVDVGLASDKGYPRRAVIDFVDNQVAPETATVRVRAVLANAKNEMMPGMSVRARIPLGEPYDAVMVADQIVQSKNRNAWIFVVNADNRVETRFVKLGPLQSDGLRVIAGGLKKDEIVLVQSVTSVVPGMQIQPKRVPMASLDSPALKESSR